MNSLMDFKFYFIFFHFYTSLCNIFNTLYDIYKEDNQISLKHGYLFSTNASLITYILMKILTMFQYFQNFINFILRN